ncbi:hypothetical protein RND81_12G092900 [Saponaria officinalis]|uniref:Uncharacterized protein n=1 Tax=Saponaria officinalis TaxID=3572 RepID=A0AAW1H8E6_SAPOF
MSSTQPRKTLWQAQNGAQLTVSNQTLANLTFFKSINWFGKVSSPGYPAIIHPNASGLFSHLRNTNDKSMAAVIYSGTNQSMQLCAWILAWCAPAKSIEGNKIYVFCGPQSLIESMTDDQIRVSLESSFENSNATDTAAKISANATINDTVPTMATVGANFSLIP